MSRWFNDKGVRSGWPSNPVSEDEYPIEVLFDVHWPNRSSKMKFRTATYEMANTLAEAVVDALIAPHMVTIEFKGNLKRCLISGEPETVRRQLQLNWY